MLSKDKWIVASQKNGSAVKVLKTEEEINGYKNNPSLRGRYKFTPYNMSPQPEPEIKTEPELQKIQPINLVEPEEAKSAKRIKRKRLNEDSSD